MIERRNNSRDTLDADERPRSWGETSGSDESGIYERPDWPLPSSAPIREQILEEEERWQQQPYNNGKERMGRLDKAAYLGEPDVSDIEEVSDEDEDYDLYVDLPRHNYSEPSPTLGRFPRPQDRSWLIEDREEHNVSPVPEEQEVAQGIDQEEEKYSERSFGDGVGSGTSDHIHGSREQADVTTSVNHLRQSSTFTMPEVDDSPMPPMPNGIRNSLVNGASSEHHPHRSSYVLQNRQRIRYSWQSHQDDGSNRPRIHIIKLISNTATASAGFPQGEAFGFSISPGGSQIAAYNSARLYVLQANALPMGISQDYALKRRPVAVELTDDGETLAILADGHTVNIYRFGPQWLQRVRTIKLDFPTNCIALAPTGGLLAAAFEGGVEIFSLDSSALPTDRRAVRAIKMDRLMFSDDGSTLLGTTTRINASSTIVVSVPVFPASQDGVPTHEELKEGWCSGLLHPENIRNSSHAMFMREDRKTSNERLFAWNGLVDTFGVLHISDLQYSKVGFPVLIDPPLSTCGGLGAAIHSCPAIDEEGDTVAMIVNDRTIRLYIVPSDVEDNDGPIEAHSIDHELDEGYGCPFSELRWVRSSTMLSEPMPDQIQAGGRLIVTSPGGLMDSRFQEDSVEDIEGGRIILLDFDPQYSGQPGQTFSLTLGKSSPQTLEEEKVDVAEAVALVRRRTVNQSKSSALNSRPATLGRSATSLGGNRLPRNDGPNLHTTPHRASMMSLGSVQSDASRSLPDLLESRDHVVALEEPYAQNAPRSQVSMQRAASNAQRHRYQSLEERNQQVVSADPDATAVPLPEYTEEPNAPLPNRFRAMAGLDRPAVYTPTRPTLLTNMDTSTTTEHLPGPVTAPPDIAEHFSADQAFQAASAQNPVANHSHVVGGVAVRAPSQPPRLDSLSHRIDIGRNGTLDSMRSMPRGIQRAYANGQPPMMTSFVPENEARDVVSPVESSRTLSPFSRVLQISNPLRQPNPFPNNSGNHTSPRRAETPSSYAASVASSAPSSHGSQRASAAHVKPSREAAASASLFPTTQPSNHVPMRQPSANPGSIAHPVTAWHPPAPSSHLQQQYPRRSGSGRGHSRKSSLAGKSAFASTAQAKRLGFFKGGNSRKPDSHRLSQSLTAPAATEGRDGSALETKSIMTWTTKSESRCILM